MMACFPDPVATASLYCSGALDLAVSRAFAPCWSDLRADGLNGECYPWMLRYARGGEHLKLRFHAPLESAPAVRRRLAERVEAFFAEIGPATAGDRHVEPQAPPIDPEDEEEGEPADRSLRWTTCRRSPLIFGASPFVEDESYVTRFTRCLGAATLRSFSTLSSDGADGPAFRTRYATLFELVDEALGELDLGPDRRLAYLAFHRDWLVRVVVAHSPAPAAMVRKVLDRFDLQIERRQAAGPTAGETDAASPVGEPGPWPWGPTVAAFFARAGELAARAEGRIEPFAPEAVFAPLFKMLHAVANGLGMNPLNEGLVHHELLARAGGGDGHREVRLTP
jgi:hypothetical protein